jgi:hypothetical protein
MSSSAAVSGPTPHKASRAGASGDQRDDQLVEALELAAGKLGAPAQLAQRDPGRVTGDAAGTGPQRRQLSDQVSGRVPGEPGADVIPFSG